MNKPTTSNLRFQKRKFFFGGFLIYICSVSGFYLYKSRKNKQLKLQEEEEKLSNLSFISDEERDRAVSLRAKEYDSLVGFDEILIGTVFFRRFLIRKAKGDVLEIASGTGRNLAYYKPSLLNSITLTDSNSEMLKLSQSKLAQLSSKKKFPSPKFLQINAQTLPFPDNSFDTVVDTFGLCSISDPVAALKEMQRVCKPNGQILLLEHGSSSWKYFQQKLDKGAINHAAKWGCWWNRDILAILQQSQIKVEKLHRTHFGTTYYIVATPSEELKLQKELRNLKL